MQAIATGIKKKMARMSKNKETQWPPRSNERLINLQLVQTERKEGFGAHNLKDERKKKRTPICYTNIFKSEKGNVIDRVIVEGNAGIGKTTLCTIFNKGWAENKMFQNFECVFLLPLRDIEVSSATKLEDIVQLFHTSEEICTSAVKELKINQGEPVLIIADGWDELDAQNRLENSFLYKLLVLGKILPLASVLVTSRSSASAPLHGYQFRFIEVVGFDEENIQEYIESEFEDYPEKGSSLIEQLKSNTLLQSICSIPLNCALICHMWHTLKQSLPNSMTKLYSLLVLCFVLRNLKKRFQDYSSIHSLENFDDIRKDLQEKFFCTCQFAYECLLSDNIVFSQQVVAKHFPEVLIKDSQDEILCFGLLQSAESLLPNGQGLSFHFAHLTVQEFLAAFHVATQSRQSKLSICNIYAKNDRFEVMWRFVFGLCSNDGNYSECIKPIDDDFLDSFFLRAKSEELLLCHCAAELNGKTFSTQVASKLDGDLSIGADNLLDCNAVFHILRHTSPCSNVIIDLSGCGMSDRQLKELADILSIAGTKLKVRSLELDNNKLTGEGMSNLFNRASASLSSVEDIDIDTNKITVLSIPPKLESLSASNNPLGIGGLQSLTRFAKAGLLVKLESLTLENVFSEDLIEDGSDVYNIFFPIGQCCPSFRLLDLSKNRFDETKAFALGKALPYLCNNRKSFNLDLSESNFDTKLAVAFSNGIMYTLASKSFIQSTKTNCSLTLTNNSVGYSGLLAILRIVGVKHCFITEIECDDTKFCCTEQDLLAAENLTPFLEFPINHSSLKCLDLRKSVSTKGTYIKSLEIVAREGLLCNLEDLNLSKALAIDPQENGALLTTLLPPMTVHCYKLKSLDLSNNQLDKVAAKVLGYAFVKFTADKKDFDLDLSDTCLNSAAVMTFCRSVIKTPLQVNTINELGDIEIDFSQNAVGHDGLSSIFSMLNSNNCLITGLTLDDITEKSSLDHKVNMGEELITPGTSKLSSLSLYGNKMFEDGLHIECLERAAREGAFVLLQKLNLSNTLSDSAALNGVLLSKLLPSIASGCVSLTELNLSDNMLNIQSAAHTLGQTLPNLFNTKKEFSLDLSDCHLDTDSITTFSECAVAALSSTTQIQFHSDRNISLDLSRNPLQCEGLVRIINMLRCNHCTITSLDLSETISGGTYNPHLYNPESNCINTHLTKLVLDENNLGGSKVLLFSKFLHVCRCIKELSCWGCSLSSYDITTILHHLRKLNISLKMLRKWNLMDCTIDDEGAYALLDSTLDVFSKLETINLDNNLVHDKVLSKLKQKLKERTQEHKLIAKKQKKRNEALAEWKETQSLPKSDEILVEFFEMWDELLDTLIENILEEESDEEIDFINSEHLKEYDSDTDQPIDTIYSIQPIREQQTEHCGTQVPIKQLTQNVISVISIEQQKEHFSTSAIKQPTRDAICSIQPTEQQTEHFGTSPIKQPTQDAICSIQPMETQTEHCCTSPMKKQTQDIPDISVLFLERELKSLTHVQLFGVYLSIPLHKINAMIEPFPHDIEEQKLALFEYIARNSITFGITWASISDALSNLGYGDLALSIRQKYCNFSEE